MSQALHPSCPKNVLEPSKYWTSKDQRSPTSKLPDMKLLQTVNILFHLHENRTHLSARPIKSVFSISSYLFPCLLWLNFEDSITCQLCRFRRKSATVYVLRYFFQCSSELVFFLTSLEFSLTEFLRVFFLVYFLLRPRKKTLGKSSHKKCSLKFSQKYPSR